MFRLSMFLAVVAVAVAAGLILVGERTAVTRTGYRVAELERERLRLVEENQRLEAEVAKRKDPVKIYKRAIEFGIGAEPPEARLRKLRDGSAKERPRADASKTTRRR